MRQATVNPKGLHEHDSSACFDRTYRNAVDRNTGIVAFSKGEQLLITRKPNESIYHSHIRPFIRKRVELTSPDLRGHRFGRFKVEGMAKELKGRWVVRCSCGIYEIRSAKAITNPQNQEDSCHQCRNVVYQIQKWHKLQKGKESSPVPKA